MDLGGAVCTPRNPRCDECPLASDCRALAQGTRHLRPEKSPSRRLPHHLIAVVALTRGEKLLIGKRPENGLLGGLWEFPGGKIEAGESPRQAAARELREEMCIEASIGSQIAIVPHAFSHFRVTLHAFEAKWIYGEPCGRSVTECRWVLPDELADYAFPAANREIINRLAATRPRA
jgi:A/G-specific adenine glycosylase